MRDYRLPRRKRTIRFREISAGLATASVLLTLVWPVAALSDIAEAHGSIAPSGKMLLAQADAAREIITLTNKPPERSNNRDPSSQALIETWLSGYGWGNDKRFDLERYEIVSRRVVWDEFGRALLQFRV